MNPIEHHTGLRHYLQYRPHRGPRRQGNAVIASIFGTTVDVINLAERKFMLDRARALIKRRSTEDASSS